MENYVELLNHLIELKKTKKEANKIERKQFIEAWKAMLSSEGYSSKAEGYLYKGFTYCGALPLRDYIKNSEDSISALKAVFSGKRYGENCTSTVPLLFHLLALFLNEKKADPNIISLIINKVPAALKNKEKRLYGQADRAFKKYMLDEMHTETLPDIQLLRDNGLESKNFDEFIKLFDEIISMMKIDRFSKKCQQNINLLQGWLHSNYEENPVDVPVNAAKHLVEKLEKTGNNTDHAVKAENADKTIKEGAQLEACKGELKKVRKELKELKEQSKDFEQQKALVAKLKQELLKYEEEQKRLDGLLIRKEDKIKDLRKNLDLAKLNEQELQRQATELEQEIKEYQGRIEWTKRNCEYKIKAAFNRLGADLRIEYGSVI